MLDDSKGQISIELVLVLAFILIIVLAIVQYIGPETEQDTALSAAKMGVINASNDLAYTGTGNVIRFNNMTFDNGSITVTVYSKFPLNSNTHYIENKAITSINSTLSNVINSTNTSVQTKRYNYTVTVVNVV